MAGTPGVVAYELNVSCPNVKGGMLFGCDPGLAAEVTRAVKAETDLPVIVKLTPSAPDVVAVARACEEAGADGLTAINTVLGMRIDTARRRRVAGHRGVRRRPLALLGRVLPAVGGGGPVEAVVAHDPDELGRAFDPPRADEGEAELLSERIDAPAPCLDERVQLSRADPVMAKLVFHSVHLAVEASDLSESAGPPGSADGGS